MLVKKTKSLCPTCMSVLESEIIEDNGKIWLVRTCPEHGQFKDLYWGDAEMYRRFEAYDTPGRGVDNPQVACPPPDSCPTQCGLCSSHQSGTLLANIDLTNRCNLDCDFCFANARACGFVYEPTFDEIVKMMEVLRGERPCPTPAVQLSGGEPTMRDDLIEIIRKAKELGFPQVQMATNGVKIAKDPTLAMKLKEAGLSTVYLHFDGVTKDTNPFLEIHKKAIENCEAVTLGIVLVPTIIRGRNDHQAADIIRFAAEHVEVIRGVNFQPVAFTGAMSPEDMENQRITVPDLLNEIEVQTGSEIRKSDFYPVPCVVPFSDLVEAYTGKPQIRFTAHQHCGAATYVFIKEGKIVPINRIVNVDKFFETIEKMTDKIKKGGAINKYTALLEGVKNLRDAVKMSEEGSTSDFWKMMGKMLISQNFDALRDFHWNALFIGTMHFMDRYNYDVSRVQRCCIHYATPDGKLIPFCTYNSGPVYREKVWKQFERKDLK